MEEHQLVLIIPGMKKTINQLLKANNGEVKASALDTLETALHMFSQLKKRELTKEETKQLKEILLNPKVKPDDLYKEIGQSEIFDKEKGKLFLIN